MKHINKVFEVTKYLICFKHKPHGHLLGYKDQMGYSTQQYFHEVTALSEHGTLSCKIL